MRYRRIPQAGAFTCRAVAHKLETQNQKEDQISIRTTPDNAESEVFSDSRRFFYDFFLEKVTLYGSGDKELQKLLEEDEKQLNTGDDMINKAESSTNKHKQTKTKPKTFNSV